MNNKKRIPIYTIYLISCLLLCYFYNVLDFPELLDYLKYILRGFEISVNGFMGIIDWIFQLCISLFVFFSPIATGMHIRLLLYDAHYNFENIISNTAKIIDILGKFSKSLTQKYLKNSSYFIVRFTYIILDIISFLGFYSVYCLQWCLILYGFWNIKFLGCVILSVIVLCLFMWYYDSLHRS